MPPLPQVDRADWMAGTSSMDEELPDIGVQVEAREWRVLVLDGRVDGRVRDWDRVVGRRVNRARVFGREGILTRLSRPLSLIVVMFMIQFIFFQHVVGPVFSCHS